MSSVSGAEPTSSDLEMLDPPPSAPSLYEEAYAPDTIVVPLWVSKKNRRRLLRLSSHADKETAAYALATVPPSAGWGTGHFFSRYLAVEHDPATLYALGSLHELTFRLAAGELPNFTISIDFLRNGDRESLAKLMKRARPRPVCISKYFSASPSLTEERTSFCDIFDATSGVRPKSEMIHVNLASLTPGDIVLLETSFVRRMLTYSPPMDFAKDLQYLTAAFDTLHIDDATVDVAVPTKTLENVHLNQDLDSSTSDGQGVTNTAATHFLWATSTDRETLVSLCIHDPSHLRRLVCTKHARGRSVLLPGLIRPRWGPSTTGTFLWGTNTFVTIVVPGIIADYDISSGTLKIALKLLTSRYNAAWRRLLTWSSPPTG
ncbi:hypothetical protein LXA43DRAFT_1064706 [Ganoderma leucocontextum]|nr:hypothetical protein LXA43DRAFT_1064706 [Ganoderma leucocontextum]